MRRRRTAIFFLVLGIALTALAIALNIGWIILNIREVALLVLGAVFFTLIITGLILNTIFLVREIRRNEQHDAFLNAVTHELKTPIASIRLYLETLRARDEKLPPERRREFYDRMLEDNDRLLRTVEQVLEASRTRERKRSVGGEEPSEVELASLLEETASVVRGRFHLPEDSIRVTAPDKPIVVLGRRGELQTVFSNLLENAVKYSGSEPKIAVRIKASAMNRAAEIYIKDNGIGIAPADAKRIFKRFYRAPSGAAAGVKGTGLGLPIVRAIVKKHGGRVGVESKGPGRGSTFWVRLPRG
ncbi:MAG: sensor histidine kinase [Pyrinomonadaceae bacterium]